jgi:carboxymethylenebutenolidase
MRIELPSGTPAELVSVDAPERGLVIVPDLWGLRPLFDTHCKDLSRRTGWSVIAVEPFPGEDLPGERDEDGYARRSEALSRAEDAQLLADLQVAADLTGADRVGVMGFCMGGMYALKASATGRFDRAVSFYGMVRLPEAWKGAGQGEPLDAVARRGTCQVLELVGTSDTFVPVEDMDALEAAGAQVVRYEGAEHGFVHDASRATHRPDDAADAWRRALEFLSS